MKPLGVLILIALCCSVIVNGVLFSLARKLYADRLASQVWIGGTAPNPATIPFDASVKTTVLLLGDSRIADWGVPQLKNSRVINAGMPGATTAQLAFRCPELLQTYQPQIAVVEIGINDLKLLGVRRELRHAVISCSLSNISLVVQECRRRNIRVLLMPVWPADGPAGLRRFVWSDAVEQGLTELNREIKAFQSDASSVRIVDPFTQLTKTVALDARKTLFRDMLHLTPDTYLRLSPLLETALEPWLK